MKAQLFEHFGRTQQRPLKRKNVNTRKQFLSITASRELSPMPATLPWVNLQKKSRFFSSCLAAEEVTCLCAITSHILVNCCLWNLKVWLRIKKVVVVSTLCVVLLSIWFIWKYSVFRVVNNHLNCQNSHFLFLDRFK